LIRAKGKGSILAHLKSKNWAQELEAAYSDNKYHTLLEIEVRVTSEGLKHWKGIGDIIFGYFQIIRNLKSSKKHKLFKELKAIYDIDWNTKTRLEKFFGIFRIFLIFRKTKFYNCKIGRYKCIQQLRRYGFESCSISTKRMADWKGCNFQF